MKKIQYGWICIQIILAVGIIATVIFGVVAYIKGQPGQLVKHKNTTVEDQTSVSVLENETAKEFSVPDIDVNYKEVMQEKLTQEEKQAIESQDYFCADSADRILTNEDITALKAKYPHLVVGYKNSIQMAAEEIFARYGMVFLTEETQNYFESKSWYQPNETYKGDFETIYGMLNDVERANVDFLMEYMESSVWGGDDDE